ncbi:ACT domain-containing protein [Fimicolochytrium jonesii]|uniref:ACT domain-containing protein n=1 Tax=Fimicolochytrium jonesii TaxID=1396493 RepID=UPI0022FEB1B2|nr:ACT domain-containing protein [Fimicolochytrium jonesii]KAI8824301.1 ACT domain-containing protein [Fimicolochytrium jonesii]
MASVTPKLTLGIHPQSLSIHRFTPIAHNISLAAGLLATASQPTYAPLASLTITSDEVSVILPSSLALPSGESHGAPQGEIKTEGDWIAVQVAGTLDFALVGILAYLTAPLKEAGVSVFCVSTYDTDWILIKEDKVEEAKAAWERVGCKVVDAQSL